MRLFPLCLAFLAATAACATNDEIENDSRICEVAAAHMESCLPGLVATRPETCGAQEQAESQWALEQSCPVLLAQAADGKADAVPAMKGIRIKKVGSRTYFMIPLAQTFSEDRERLLQETVTKFNAEMGKINTQLISRGIDMSEALTGDAARQFTDHYIATVNNLLASQVDTEIETALGATIAEPRRMSTWDRYVIPQAFIAYFSSRFSVSWGISGGVSATVMIVAQPWLSLAVDHTAAQPTVVGKNYELDVAVIGVPSVEIGGGVGGGFPLRIGVGAVFGPLNKPNDVAGWGIGLSASGTAPIVGGLSGKFLTVLRYPPLFMLMLGYSTGTAAEVEIHGDLQRMMDLNAFLEWIETVTG
ncbi:MAG TPA: hypothetical protein VM513_33830 [Kofleriaceae bacterium]|jgi:hypothetical protein|nr:hypothetical protein [Kofleriaceae bacterium]